MIIEVLKTNPESLVFADVIAFIDEHYNFTPTPFKNGEVMNEAGQNNGSCKVLSFAKMNNLSLEETLYLFAEYYRNDVLQNPEGENHQNIRNFMKYGWEGVLFESKALVKK